MRGRRGRRRYLQTSWVFAQEDRSGEPTVRPEKSRERTAVGRSEEEVSRMYVRSFRKSHRLTMHYYFQSFPPTSFSSLFEFFMSFVSSRVGGGAFASFVDIVREREPRGGGGGGEGGGEVSELLLANERDSSLFSAVSNRTKSGACSRCAREVGRDRPRSPIRPAVG